MKNTNFILLLLLLFISENAIAATLSDVSVVGLITKSMAPAIKILYGKALIFFGAFVSLQFVWTNFNFLKSDADLSTVIGKTAGSLIWVGVCMVLLNNGPGFIADVGASFFTMLGLTLPSPGLIMGSTIAIVASLTATAAIVGVASTTIGTLIVYVLFLIFFIGMYFAVRIFLLQLELAMVVMLSPLSFSLLGLNALKEQGIAPLKSLISLGFRIILATLILSGYTEVGSAVVDTIDSISAASVIESAATFVETIFSGLGAYILLTYLLYKSDSIAASLTSGSTSMAPGDIAGAVSAGVAGGMAIHAATQAASAGVSSMSDFMKNMMGGGEMKNAGATGGGGVPPGAPMSSAPQASLDDQMQGVAASEREMAGGDTGGSGDTGLGSSAGGVGGGTSDSKSAAPFSKADGAKAAGAVPASAGQNTKNAAAVGAAMRASGAHENMAALAEDMAEQGNGASAISNACCNSPEQSAAVGNAMAGAAKVGGNPAWLDSGNASSPGGSGSGAGIGNGGTDAASKEPTMKDHLANLGKRMGEAGKHLENEKAATHISISTHNSD